MLQNQNRKISRDELLDKLWPEEEPERAVKQLYNGTYYIRKALEAYGIDSTLIRISSGYSLQLGPVDWDVGRYCALFQNHTEDRNKSLAEMEALYTDDYLEGEFYPWSDFERERLSKLYDQCVIDLSKSYISEKKYDQAEALLLKAYHKDPYLEDISELLLRLYNETGNASIAVKHYNAYAALIKEELDIQPGKRLQELIKR